MSERDAMELAELRRLVRTGEYLQVHDSARALHERLRTEPERTEAAYLAALALARSGATDVAEAFADAALDPMHDDLPPGLARDVSALRARIAKDRALVGPETDAPARFVEAARRYEATFDEYGGSYPAVNAATTWLLAGDLPRSRRLARAAMDALGSDDDEWAHATRAEAALLLDDIPTAAQAVQAAADASRGRWGERATTRRQLTLVCATKHLDVAVLDPLMNPVVAHYTGHRMDPPGAPATRFAPDDEQRVADAVATVLDERRIGIVFGALASGADIIVAEQVVARGGEVHVVLPFDAEAFLDVSVIDGGPAWVARFHECLGAATSVRVASDGAFLGDAAMFDFGAQVAMGEAVNHAAALATAAEQLAIWDGQAAADDAVAGTAVDVARWRALGLPTTIVPVGPGSSGSVTAEPATDGGQRNIRAMLFGDIAGFSKLGDAELPTFMDEVMRPIGECIASFGDDVLLRATWGDGIYLVFADTLRAAQCALALQATMRAIDLDAIGLGVLKGLRIGAHVGPAFDGVDPVTGGRSVYGANVTRAARIEPRTPEGEVYVTQPFAALVALGADVDLSCDYVGRLPTAKDYGVLPMYVLKPGGR